VIQKTVVHAVVQQTVVHAIVHAVVHVLFFLLLLLFLLSRTGHRWCNGGSFFQHTNVLKQRTEQNKGIRSVLQTALTVPTTADDTLYLVVWTFVVSGFQ
jgi:hypothetical protein